MPGEAWLTQREIGLEKPPHLSLPKTSRQYVILDDGESEAIPITEVEGAGLRVCQASGLGQDPLRQQSEVALARQTDPDLDQFDERARPRFAAGADPDRGPTLDTRGGRHPLPP